MHTHPGVSFWFVFTRQNGVHRLIVNDKFFHREPWNFAPQCVFCVCFDKRCALFSLTPTRFDVIFLGVCRTAVTRASLTPGVLKKIFVFNVKKGLQLFCHASLVCVSNVAVFRVYFRNGIGETKAPHLHLKVLMIECAQYIVPILSFSTLSDYWSWIDCYHMISGHLWNWCLFHSCFQSLVERLNLNAQDITIQSVHPSIIGQDTWFQITYTSTGTTR